jgi:hypothetical protein
VPVRRAAAAALLVIPCPVPADSAYNARSAGRGPPRALPSNRLNKAWLPFVAGAGYVGGPTMAMVSRLQRAPQCWHAGVGVDT